MEKRLVDDSLTNDSIDRLVVDTSYLLPITGIKVKGISVETIECILDNYEVYYPVVMLVELEAVVLREARKSQLANIPEDAIEGINTIVYSPQIRLVLPEGTDLVIAYELVKLGWKDIFDSMLYATGVRLNAHILTLDNSFKQFLKNNKLEYEHLITHKRLEKCYQ